jgi:F420-dependent oxidoreductase-like protein
VIVVRIGLNLANFAPRSGPRGLGTELAGVARRAEEAGFDSFWVWDHFFWDELPVGPGVTDRPMIEAYTTLGFVAGVTRTIKLGTMVASATYRHPGVLVNEVTTLDVLSGGRAVFGIGAGWFEEEHRALGIPFPATAERFERLEETVQIALQMWADQGRYDRAEPFHGRHYRLERTLNVPQAVQRPHPPILIGGSGERKTLRLVARYADACNLNGRLPAEDLTRKLHVLRRHCEEAGRPYDAIEKTVYARVRIEDDGAVSMPEVLGYCRSMAALGFDAVIAAVDGAGVYRPAALDVWARELLPAIRRIPVAGR